MTSRDWPHDTADTVDSPDSGPSGHACPACRTTVPHAAVDCPGCGRRQTEPVASGTVTASPRWGDVLFLGVLAWVGLFCALVFVPGTPSLSGSVGAVTVFGSLWLAVTGYFDMTYLRQQTGWNPDTPVWVVGLALWFFNIPVGLFYLYKRHRALRGHPPVAG
jgi:hypothetical protein